ncbi:MAG: hypothetical protein AAGF46_06655 [Pseudomonadota bacterium]
MAHPALLEGVQSVLEGTRLSLVHHAADAPLPGSYWGAPEAGLVGSVVHVRPDTPLHSLLHETCHAVCMTPGRRAALDTDAGGEEIEECAVCLLQLCIAETLPGVGWQQLAADMDAWGYSFRHGSTVAWLAEDAGDARRWLAGREHVWRVLPAAVARAFDQLQHQRLCA